ncbi:hypothetical protein E2562_013105, partial [Oryza meyeriana var. granulata]
MAGRNYHGYGAGAGPCPWWCIALNAIAGDSITVSSFAPPDDFKLALLTLELVYTKARANRNEEIVNGPEVLSKFVGETEKSVRDLFADAENDQRTQAARTKNYSEAELEGVVKSAVSFALNQQISMDDLTKPLDEESIKVFEDAYKSQFGIIILDDIERLLKYVAIGPRFSNLISQTLLVLLKKVPPKGKNLLVIGTRSEVGFLESIGMCDVFCMTYHVPKLKKEHATK